jgi:dihydrofolate reductase
MQAARVAPPGFACVVAAEESRGIGWQGRLPWPRLRADLAHLKAITTETRAAGMRNAVVMGRRTWETIPRRNQPLPGRLNVVVSRGALELPAGARAAASLDAALAVTGVEQIYVIGGGQIYAEAVRDPRCRYIYYTRVLAHYKCDAFFPPFEEAFVREEVLPAHHEAGVSYQIERWARR